MRRTLLRCGVAAGLSFLLFFLWIPTCSADVWYLDDGDVDLAIYDASGRLVCEERSDTRKLILVR